jgi:hypothetical protein
MRDTTAKLKTINNKLKQEISLKEQRKKKIQVNIYIYIAEYIGLKLQNNYKMEKRQSNFSSPEI